VHEFPIPDGEVPATPIGRRRPAWRALAAQATPVAASELLWALALLVAVARGYESVATVVALAAWRRR
jgi:hypothetical protein